MIEIIGKCNIKCLSEERFKLNYYPLLVKQFWSENFPQKTLKKGAQRNKSKTLQEQKQNVQGSLHTLTGPKTTMLKI